MEGSKIVRTGRLGELDQKIAATVLEEYSCIESEEVVRRNYRLAKQWREEGDLSLDLIAELEEIHEVDLTGWLLSIPFCLADYGLIEEARDHALGYAEILESVNFLGDLGVILSEAGCREEALGLSREMMERFPRDAWVVIKAGDVFRNLGEFGDAEYHYLSALDLSRDDPYTQKGVFERYLPMLMEMGREEEAGELEKFLAAETQQDKQDDILGIYRRKSPKIGRNDPCPCGSGKKFKKCCM